MDVLLILLYTLGFGLLGYLCGSLPFAIWINRLFKGVDVREAGSGHAAADLPPRAHRPSRGLVEAASCRHRPLRAHESPKLPAAIGCFGDMSRR
jgi:hypothetical protein